MQGFKHFWIGIVDFQRMENRKDYWSAILLNNIATILLIILGIFIRIVMPYIALIYAIVSILPTISMTVRRLHDVDESGFYMFFALIPIGGAILILLKTIKPTQYNPQSIQVKQNETI